MGKGETAIPFPLDKGFLMGSDGGAFGEEESDIGLHGFSTGSCWMIAEHYRKKATPSAMLRWYKSTAGISSRQAEFRASYPGLNS